MTPSQTHTNLSPLEDKIYGCLLGGLIGDAMGAPCECKTYQQIIEQYGPQGVTDFEGRGTDDTAIREQLVHAILENDGHITCDEFAKTFLTFRQKNYDLWWVPVRNLFHKLESDVCLPVDAGWGNAPSSSSAMAISPMGILNAADPRRAARETFDVAGLVHSGPTGFCRDAACAMAAAAAAAFLPNATPASVVDAATAYLHPASGRLMIEIIAAVRELARSAGGYEAFRQRYYERHLYPVMCDSRETVPATLAIFELAGGDPEKAIRWGASFGRDADTIGTMVGGLCGALRGSAGLPAHWVAKVEANPEVDYRERAARLAGVVRRRAHAAAEYAGIVGALAQMPTE